MPSDVVVARMNADTISVVCSIASLGLLLATGQPLWLLTFALSSFYGGWRLGHRLIDPEVFQ